MRLSLLLIALLCLQLPINTVAVIWKVNEMFSNFLNKTGTNLKKSSSALYNMGTLVEIYADGKLMEPINFNLSNAG
ncbi:uncharacterized protein DMAD_04149 [Drosophila madeirensis]|uniref:Uncharacterized protein n=1 Tax=Drosophila madeirensis TaxID=30013 RepID=A0AAU9GCQ8_DROMD